MNQQLILFQLQAFLLSFVDQMRNDEAIKQLHAEHGHILDWHEEKIQRLQPAAIVAFKQLIQSHLQHLFASNQNVAMNIAHLIESYLPLPRTGTEYEEQNRTMLLESGAEAFLLKDQDVQIDSLWLHAKNIELSKLHTAYLPGASVYVKKHTMASVVIFPGNGGCFEECRPLAAWYVQRGLNVLLFNYRGSVKSKGKPSENGYYQDAMSAYQKLQNLLPLKEEHILFHGISLGGAVATKTAEMYPRINLVLDQTFSTISEVIGWQAQKMLPMVFGPQFPWIYKELLLRVAARHLHFDCCKSVAQSQGHIFIVRSTEDQVIPPGCADRLKMQARNAASATRLDTIGQHCCDWFLTDSQAITQFENFLVQADLCDKIT